MKKFQDRFHTTHAQHNEHALLRWDGRWARLEHYIETVDPDILTLQELDRLHEVQARMEVRGYSCGQLGPAIDSRTRSHARSYTSRVLFCN